MSVCVCVGDCWGSPNESKGIVLPPEREREGRGGGEEAGGQGGREGREWREWEGVGGREAEY